MEHLADAANVREADRALFVAEALQATLVDLIAISLQAKHLHWNVFGRHFKTVHEHLDELTDVLRDHADEIAERMAAMGTSPDGRAMTVTHGTNLVGAPDGFLPDRQVVETIVHNLELATRQIRGRFEAVGEVDLVSQDLLVQAVAALEKQLWMFTQMLKGWE